MITIPSHRRFIRLLPPLSLVLAGVCWVISPAYANPVNPTMAEADRAPGSRPVGKVEVLDTAGNGAHTPTDGQTITVEPNSKDNSSPPTPSLTVQPELEGSSIEAYIQPPSGRGDIHNIQVDSRDDGLDCSFVPIRLSVQFPATAGNGYVVTWVNKSMTINWDGLISLPLSGSSGIARFQAWTSSPYFDNDSPADEVALIINPDDVTNPTKWEFNKTGPVSYPISESKSIAPLKDAGNAELSMAFNFTPTSLDIYDDKAWHESYVRVRVRLNHSVATEASGTSKFTSKTTLWKIDNWKLDVSIEKP